MNHRPSHAAPPGWDGAGTLGALRPGGGAGTRGRVSADGPEASGEETSAGTPLEKAPPGSGARWPGSILSTALPWLGLVLAFSPALVDLGRHLAGVPRDRYALVGALLFALGVLGERGRPARPRPGGRPLLGIAVLLQLVGIAVDTWTAARLGLALGVVGMALVLGRPSPRVALLSLAALPIPVTLLEISSPALETGWAAAAAAVLGAAGLDVEAAGAGLRAAGELLPLRVDHGGGPLALVAAALCWYAGIRGAWPVASTLALCPAAGLAGLAFQGLAVIVAGGALALGGGRDLGESILDSAWLALGVGGLLAVHGRSARPSSPWPPPGSGAGAAGDGCPER